MNGIASRITCERAISSNLVVESAIYVSSLLHHNTGHPAWVIT